MDTAYASEIGEQVSYEDIDIEEQVSYIGPDEGKDVIDERPRIELQSLPRGTDSPRQSLYGTPDQNADYGSGRCNAKFLCILFSVAVTLCLVLAVTAIVIVKPPNVKDVSLRELKSEIETLREMLAKQEARLKLTTHQLKTATDQLNSTTQQLIQQAKQIREQENVVEEQTMMGDVYTRWGRTVCGDNSTLVYKGFASGSDHTHSGGGVNYQCLPEVPEYHRYYNGGGWLGAYIYGAEYQAGSYGIFPNSADNQNVPCARCYTNNRPAVMMIPAMRTCPGGWTREYEGYLMTNYWSYPHAATFECVDTNPEYIEGLAGNTDGALFYFTRAACNGIPCPPYFTNRELTCVVCTK